MAPVCEQEENCDDTYEVGAIVENRFGSWQYLGDNQWETLSLAENVTEITSRVGRAWHRFNNINDHFHDFGDRTIAESNSNVVSVSLANNEIAGIVGGPARGVITAFRSGSNLLGQPINLTQKSLAHTLNRHTTNNISKFANKSKFFNSSEVTNLIQQATHQRMIRQANGNYARIVDAGRNIGLIW